MFTFNKEPRRAFKGVLRVNEGTNREELVHPKIWLRYVKFSVSACFILGMMLSTVLLAYVCTTVGTLGNVDQYLGAAAALGGSGSGSAAAEGELSASAKVRAAVYANLFKILASVGNLLIIQIMGALYEHMAVKLNDWENHRTQTEYDNNLIVKNFAFQFVNNYFTFFYIAYMKHLEDPIWGKSDPCDRSCLPAMQTQLLIVFTGKTLGGKVAELVLPFVKKRMNQAAAQIARGESVIK